jgi:hypothetical protein
MQKPNRIQRPRRPRWAARAAAAATLAAALLAAALPVAPGTAGAGPARASAEGTGLLVTVAARECASYQDIRANLARNNIMESLEDLGLDTL